MEKTATSKTERAEKTKGIGQLDRYQAEKTVANTPDISRTRETGGDKPKGQAGMPPEIDARAQTTHLSREGRKLLDKDLNDRVGAEDELVSEAIAKDILENNPGVLRNADGSALHIKGVAYGQYDKIRGIDLVAADRDGRPIVIEVKATEVLPNGTRELDDESCAPVPSSRGERVYQMDDHWVKDRWERMLKDPARVDKLREAGIREEFLHQEFLDEEPQLWNEILGQKAVVVVSPRGRAAISDRLYEQIPERGIKHLTAIKV